MYILSHLAVNREIRKLIPAQVTGSEQGKKLQILLTLREKIERVFPSFREVRNLPALIYQAIEAYGGEVIDFCNVNPIGGRKDDLGVVIKLDDTDQLKRKFHGKPSSLESALESGQYINQSFRLRFRTSPMPEPQYKSFKKVFDIDEEYKSAVRPGDTPDMKEGLEKIEKDGRSGSGRLRFGTTEKKKQAGQITYEIGTDGNMSVHGTLVFASGARGHELASRIQRFYEIGNGSECIPTVREQEFSWKELTILAQCDRTIQEGLIWKTDRLIKAELEIPVDANGTTIQYGPSIVTCRIGK